MPGFGQTKALVIGLRPLQGTGADQTENRPVPKPEIIGIAAKGFHAQVIRTGEIPPLEAFGNAFALTHEHPSTTPVRWRVYQG